MPVATILAIAASFWGAHGYTTAQPVTWSWATTPYRIQAYAPMTSVNGGPPKGEFQIVLSRSWWDKASNQDKCVVVIHEYGHAAFSFQHQDGTVMAEYDGDAYRPVPGTCKRSKAGWRRAARSL